MKRRDVIGVIALLAGTPPRVRAAAPAGLTLPEPGRANADALFAAPLIALDGQRTQLPHPQGRPLIVNFWARWCGPCKVEIPELVAFFFHDTAINDIYTPIQTLSLPVSFFARAYEMDYSVLLARDGGIELMRALGNSKAGLPFTLAIDRHGQMVAMRLGLMTREQLDAAVLLALQRT